MTRTGRFRFLVIGAIALAALMIAGSRRLGRTTLPGGGDTNRAGARRTAESQAAARASALEGGGDLSFYGALAKPGPGVPQTGAHGDIAPKGEETPPLGAYVVQALATRNPAQAARLRNRLAAKGLPATVVEGRAGDVPVYRVRVGRYRDRVVAEALVRRLKTEDGVVSPWVLRESE